MLRFFTLLALLPLFVALSAHGSSEFVVKRRGQIAVPRKVADIEWLQANRRKVERRYGSGDMQKRHDDKERRWVVYDANIKPDQSFVAEEDSIFSHFWDGASQIFQGGIKTLMGGSSKEASPDDDDSKNAATSSGSASDAGNKASSGDAAAAGSKVVNIPLNTQVNDDNGSEREVLANITVGKQTFVIDPDSGSADFWIVSDLCKSNCGETTTKYKTSSSSAINANKEFNIQYGAGSTSGQLYRDTAKLGDLTVRNLTIGAASRLSPELASDPAGGILGLGFREITSAGQKTFLDRLFQQEKLKNKVVSFAFGRSSSKTLGKAEMRFGDINKELIKGDVSYSPVTTKGYWQFGIQSFAAGKGNGINIDSIIDTGTSLIAVEQSQAATFWKDIPDSEYDSNQGFYTYPCASKPNAVLKTKDGKEWPITDDDFNLGALSATSDRCVGAVFPAQTRNVIVLGISFLKNAYSVLDYGQTRVGLAKYNY